MWKPCSIYSQLFVPIDGDPGATGSSSRASLPLLLTTTSVKTFQIGHEVLYKRCAGKTHVDHHLIPHRGIKARLSKSKDLKMMKIKPRKNITNISLNWKNPLNIKKCKESIQ